MKMQSKFWQGKASIFIVAASVSWAVCIDERNVQMCPPLELELQNGNLHCHECVLIVPQQQPCYTVIYYDVMTIM